jgi:MFS family permease
VVSLASVFGSDTAVLRDRNFQLLLAANVPVSVGTAVVSPVLDSLVEPFGTTAASVGLLVSFFSAPGIVVIPLVGVLADRVGRKPVLIAALVLFGASGTAVAATTDFRVALALRFLQGVGFAGVLPTLITSLGDLYTGPREATAQGLRFTVSGVSQAVLPLSAGLLVTVAWQYPFLLFALALPAAVLVYVWYEEPDPPVADGGGPGSDGTRGGRGGDGDEDATGSYLRSLLGLVSRPRVLSLVVARTLPVVVWIGFLTYNSIIVVNLMDGTPAQAGLLTAVGSVAFAATASQAGQITVLFDSRYYPLVAANVCLGVGLAVVVFAPGVPVAGVGIFLTGIGVGITLSLYRSIVTGLAPHALRAGVVGVAEAGGRVTATATPLAMGAVVATVSPALGFETALRVAGLGAALVGSLGGVACLVVASVSTPTPAEQARRPDG